MEKDCTITSSLPTCPLREEKSLSQRAFSIYTDIRKLQDKSKIKWKPKSCTRGERNPDHIAKNYLHRDFHADKPNEKWLTDVSELQMRISYNKLQKLMIDNQMKRQDLMRAAEISSSVATKLNKNETVSLDVLMRICKVFHCNIGD